MNSPLYRSHTDMPWKKRDQSFLVILSTVIFLLWAEHCGFFLKLILSKGTRFHRGTLLRGRRLYLSIHEQMPHQSHGLLQSVPLSRDEGLILVSQAARSGYHELSNLVIQAVERLDRCKGSERKLCR